VNNAWGMGMMGPFVLFRGKGILRHISREELQQRGHVLTILHRQRALTKHPSRGSATTIHPLEHGLRLETIAERRETASIVGCLFRSSSGSSSCRTD